jgi:anti-anti-sigma factor
MTLVLEVLDPGKGPGQRIPITVSPFLIGRSETCALRPASATVSPYHCALRFRRGSAFVRDFGGAHGTRVNGQRIQGEVELRDGDRLEVGPLAFRVHLQAAPPSSPAPAPPPPSQGEERKPPPEQGEGAKTAAAPAGAAAGEGRPRLFLIAANGDRRGTPAAVAADLFMIGTAEECQLRPAGAGIGPRHCAVITRDGRKVFVRDLDSGQPTFVNDEVLPAGAEWALHGGDRLGVGPLDFLVQFRERPLSQRDLEEWALSCLDRDAETGGREFDDDDIWAERRGSYNAAQAAAAVIDRLKARRGVVKGRLRVSVESSITVVRLNDAHLVDEAEIALVKKELYDTLTRHHLKILLDFKNVRRMSSVAVGMLLQFCEQVLRSGGNLALCRLHPEMLGVLEALRSAGSLKHFDDKPTALAGSW